MNEFSLFIVAILSMKFVLALHCSDSFHLQKRYQLFNELCFCEYNPGLICSCYIYFWMYVQLCFRFFLFF